MIAEKKAKKRALRNTSQSQNGRGATFAEGRNKITPLRSVIPSVCELAFASQTNLNLSTHCQIKKREAMPLFFDLMVRVFITDF